MASKDKSTQDQLVDTSFKIAKDIANSPNGQELLNKTLFKIPAKALAGTRSGKEVTVEDAVTITTLAIKGQDLYSKGRDSEVTSEMANALIKYVDLLPSEIKAEFTGSVNKPGASVSAPVGKGRAGLKMPDFNNPETASAFYEHPRGSVAVDSRSISAEGKLGKAGPFDMSVSGRVDRSGNAYAGIRGKAKFAKGGHVKQYSNSPRKPRLK
jgi:hypothetical protein